MTQRFGGIYSILSRRDYNDLVEALRSVDDMDMRVGDFPGTVPGFEGLSGGQADDYSLENEQIIQLLDKLTIPQLIEVLEYYSGGVDGDAPDLHEPIEFKEIFNSAMRDADEKTKEAFIESRLKWRNSMQTFQRLYRKLKTRKRS